MQRLKIVSLICLFGTMAPAAANEQPSHRFGVNWSLLWNNITGKQAASTDAASKPQTPTTREETENKIEYELTQCITSGKCSKHSFSFCHYCEDLPYECRPLAPQLALLNPAKYEELWKRHKEYRKTINS